MQLSQRLAQAKPKRSPRANQQRKGSLIQALNQASNPSRPSSRPPKPPSLPQLRRGR